MQWLISQIWIALGAAGFLGILFGMAVRGLFVGRKIRRAQVDRDVAKTELEQSRTEVDALYAAQRRRQEETAQTVSGDDRLQTELDAREAKISGLGDELTAARQELDALREQAGGGAETASIAETSTTDTELQERNTWLEQRVVELEAGAQADVSPDQTTGEAGTDSEELARLRWRNRYLEGRLAYHEDGAGADTSDESEALALVDPEAAPIEEVATEEEAVAEEEVVEAEVDTETASLTEPEQSSEPEPAAEPEAVATEDSTEHPSDAVLKALDEADTAGVQPASMDAPAGEADDLTKINGIGPRIAEVLNEFGIWSFAQVAEWSPENTVWIEHRLAFDGRVVREDWIAQAGQFAEAAASEDA